MKINRASRLFWLCNSYNFLLCAVLLMFQAATDLSLNKWLLALVGIVYLYFFVRLILYKIWYSAGYHPLAQDYSPVLVRKMGVFRLPMFTQHTPDYLAARSQQSLGIQVTYNIFKIVYRTLFYGLVAMLILAVQDWFSSLAWLGYTVTLLLFFALPFLDLVGNRIWKSLFYKLIPAQVLFYEREEPIFTKRH